MSRIRSRLATTLSAAALLCLSPLAPARAQAEGDFKPIFNGKDLTGWEGDPSLWSVQDGAITGTTQAGQLKYNKFLIWRGGAPKNFVLRAKLKLDGNNNSGLQYRSKQLPDAGEFVVGGYQMDVHPSPNYNGMLYDERGRGIIAEVGQRVVIAADGKKTVTAIPKPEPVKLDEWNTYEVIATGNHLIHKLNGKTTVDIVDNQEKERELEGILALQVHAGPPMKVQFKEILLATLSDGGEIAPVQPKAAARRRPAAPTGPAPEATSLASLKPLKGFQVELVHAVPRDTEGSWVSMTVDPKNRLIVSDQEGKLYRVTPSKLGESASATKVEAIDVPLGEAQGLLWAFDSLYVMVNRGRQYDTGLYRVRDTNGDDKLDKVELLRKIEGGGEHGPHAIVLSPDKKSLYVVAGNATRIPDLASSKVPPDYGEDILLPRMTDGAGFMRDEKAPGGWVAKVDPDGKSFELISMGYRNAYDLAFNRDGEGFTYDSDMEWDMNLPWYRPTRVCNFTSGSDFGYRNGSGKSPTYYVDTLPPVVDIGPGSPTGVTFGYGAKFPAKYQDALFICDWSYGKLFALHLKPRGSSYEAEVEEFVSGTPLPLTDMVVNPGDGALYFAIGGRRTTSGLYRVVYKGEESIAPSKGNEVGAEARSLRHKLEAFHGKKDAKAVDFAWNYLGHPDRFVRYAARIAIEWQDPASWREKALREADADRAIPALLALTRVSASDPAHRKPGEGAPDKAVQEKLFDALDRVGWVSLPKNLRLDLVRVYQVFLNRFGKPTAEQTSKLLAKLDSSFPSKRRDLNFELAQVLVYLEAPGVAGRLVTLLEKAPTQEEQIDYARTLRPLKTGWTPELRKSYFSWFPKAAAFKGGNSFPGFMANIKRDAIANLSESEKSDLKEVLEAPAAARAPSMTVAPRAHVKNWTIDELNALVGGGLKKRDFEKGRTMFGAASCFACHRFNNEGGGAGPDLTGLAGRFNTRDLLDSIVTPSKVISDQYGAVMIATSDGKVVTGRIVNLHGDGMAINTNMLNPNEQVQIDRRKIEEMKPSPTSMMPEGLLNTLNRDEVLDLMAYLLSRGDRENPMFK